MLDEYLGKQNKLLVLLGTILSVLAIIHASFLLVYGHPLLALGEFCITLALCSGIGWTVCENKRYIRKWNALNSIEQTSFFTIDGPNDLTENIGDLNFKFIKTS